MNQRQRWSKDFIAGQFILGSPGFHHSYFSWLTTVGIQASPWTATLHKAPCTLDRKDGVAVSPIRFWFASSVAKYLRADMQRDWVLLWWGGGHQWGITVACGVERLLRAQEGWRGSDCAAGVRSQSTCIWLWHMSWHFASPASLCAPSH